MDSKEMHQQTSDLCAARNILLFSLIGEYNEIRDLRDCSR